MQEIRFDKLKIQAFSILRRSHYEGFIIKRNGSGLHSSFIVCRASIDSDGTSGDAKTLVPSRSRAGICVTLDTFHAEARPLK